MNKTKKIIISTFSVLGIVLISFGLIANASYNFGKKDYNNLSKKVEVTHKKIETYKAIDKGIYDLEGNLFQIQGINYGNLLIQEGWMSVNSLGPKLNEDGSYAKINSEGVIEEYEEVYQEELDLALKNNPNLNQEKINELWSIYYKSYCQEIDFQNIKEIGLNTIRLPMYYRNFLEGEDDKLVMKENAFEFIDYFLENAKKYDLKVILDMHGVVGGQSGNEHSGTRRTEFWTNEVYQKEMCDLWKNIASYYLNERKDLASTILAYDLINEPALDKKVTTKREWDVMDKMYKSIREVDEDHIIAIEGCWYFDSLPDPKKYNWENVMYEFHLYNWDNEKISNDAYHTLHFFKWMTTNYDVPIYIGEFNFFDKKDEWIKWLNEYDERGLNWSIWSYKTISVGWWDMSWGIYVYKMNLIDEKLKLDVRTATYEEIKEVWSNQGTKETYKDTGILKSVLEQHFKK
jgi:hypothetical protein